VLVYAHLVLAFALLAVGITHVVLTGLAIRAADTERLRAVGRLVVLFGKLSPAVAGLTVLTGLALMFTEHDSFAQGWVIASLALVVVLGVNAPVIQRPHQERFDEALAAAPAGPVPPQVRILQEIPPLRVGQLLVPWLHLTIFYLMWEQPGTAGSLVTCAVLVGIAAVLFVWQVRRLVTVAKKLFPQAPATPAEESTAVQ
jgi:uncharacterized membrane protein